MAVWNQKVRRPVASARAVLSRFSAGKCATTVIRAFGVVDTKTPTLVPMIGCLWVTDAAAVRAAGVGVAMAVAVGVVVAVAAPVGAVGCVVVQPTAASTTATVAPVALVNLWACQRA